MKHLGDITQIHGYDIEPVDVITFGSPCQDLSVAGLRAGLQGQRSGLFTEAVRIIQEMRSATSGEYPTFAVWENVPGAFSSGGWEDFRAVLQKIAAACGSADTIPRPHKRWKNAGCIVGDNWSIAWRVLDAQYWGVPQRRKRIYLIADFGGRRAPEILFKCESLSRHFEAGEKAWKKITTRVGDSTDTTDSMHGAHIANTLTARMDGSACADRGPTVVCAGFNGKAGAKSSGAGCEENVPPTLRAEQKSPALTYDCRGNGNGYVDCTMTGDHQNRVTDYTSVVCAPYQKLTGTLSCGAHPGGTNGQDAYNAGTQRDCRPSADRSDTWELV